MNFLTILKQKVSLLINIPCFIYNNTEQKTFSLNHPPFEIVFLLVMIILINNYCFYSFLSLQIVHVSNQNQEFLVELQAELRDTV